ncbi:MAG TPA: histidine kinase, partial [Anaerolineales bacterium]|nr:histidine kinase [Anaerolineales bacterium]
MKSTGELEPGVLSTFRLFIGVQLIVSTVGVIVSWVIPAHGPIGIVRHLQELVFSTAIFTQLAITAASSSLLFLYLSIPGLWRALKSLYLPIAIIWATMIPILSPYIELRFAGNNLPEFLLPTALWQQTILLFIPLIVTSWQYSLHSFFLFCIPASLLNLILLFSGIVPIGAQLSRILLGILFIQLVAFLLVGHMLGNLLRIQREQRKRLVEANERLALHASTVEQLTLSRERNRLARELHDVLAHTLSGVAVELE